MLSPKKIDASPGDNQIFEEQKLVELNKLSPFEPNWFEVLSSGNFIIRFILIAIIVIYASIVIINVTMDSNSKSWFNKLHKPDWGPDGVVIVIIFAFLFLLFSWVWYRFYLAGLWYMEMLVVVLLVLFLLWAIFLYQGKNITVAKYLVCFLLGVSVLIFCLCVWKFGFQDVTMYSFMMSAWLIVMVVYTFGLHELDKEFKLLAMVQDKSSSLYKKKMKMEMVEGIKITDNGEKILFNPEEQE
jgi:tryptophan-rich sensory protein